MPYDEDIDDEGDYYDEDEIDEDDYDDDYSELENPPEDDDDDFSESEPDESNEERLDDLSPEEREMYEDFLAYSDAQELFDEDEQAIGEYLETDLPDPDSDQWESFDWESYDWDEGDFVECEVGIHYGEFS